MTKKNKPERTRFDALSIELNDSLINPATGKIELNLLFDEINNEQKAFLSHNGNTVESSKQVHGYFGENKMRTLWEVPKDKDDHSLNYIKKLQRYDRLISIDTNSKVIGVETYSIGVSGHLIGKVFEKYIEWEFIPIRQLFTIIGKSDKLENRNWKTLIEYILKHTNYNATHKIGMIVDSDLGEIDNYNKRMKPIIFDFYLPENFELIFASDKSQDNPLNESIKHCHNISTKSLTLLECALKKASR